MGVQVAALGLGYSAIGALEQGGRPRSTLRRGPFVALGKQRGCRNKKAPPCGEAFASDSEQSGVVSGSGSGVLANTGHQPRLVLALGALHAPAFAERFALVEA